MGTETKSNRVWFLPYNVYTEIKYQVLPMVRTSGGELLQPHRADTLIFKTVKDRDCPSLMLLLHLQNLP